MENIEDLIEYNGLNNLLEWKKADNRRKKYPFGLLNIGEHFIVKVPHCSKKRASINGAVRIWQANNNAMNTKFIVEKVNKGYLVKRIY